MSNKSLIKFFKSLNSKTNITYKGSVFLTLDNGNKLGIYLYGIMIRGIIADISKKEINRQKYCNWLAVLYSREILLPDNIEDLNTAVNTHILGENNTYPIL